MTDANHSRPPYVKLWGKEGPYAVWLVDGAFVRRELNNDFTDVDQHYHLRQIPPGEIWVDQIIKAPEIAWMAKSGAKEARLMSDGESYARAEGTGEHIERALRKNDPAQHARAKIAKIGDNGHLSIWRVKGEVVRDKYRDSFTLGGHGRVYPWMPKNEIWIEQGADPFDAYHELREWNAMGTGMKYPPAHHIATIEEHDLRRNPGKFKVAWDAQAKRAGGDLGITESDFRKLMGR